MERVVVAVLTPYPSELLKIQQASAAAHHRLAVDDRVRLSRCGSNRRRTVRSSHVQVDGCDSGRDNQNNRHERP